jgi:membrane fusion protein (multidrug efflux system)
MTSSSKKSLWALTLSLTLLGGIFFLIWEVYIKNYVRTTDAYITGNVIDLHSQISGYVKTIYVDETQKVKQGDLLVELDPSDSLLEVEKAKATLAEQVRYVCSLINDISKTTSDLEGKKALLERASYDYENRKEVVNTGSIAKEDFEHSKIHLSFSQADVVSKEFELMTLKSLLLNSSPYNHPRVEMAKAALKTALLALRRCKIYAPSDGIITQRSVQIGKAITKDNTLLSIIPLDQIWIDANFKETQLKHIKIGQHVEFHVDMWGKGIVFYGRVIGQNPGTGAVFAPIPPQNATGNWIKIVQRVPVRIEFDKQQLLNHPFWLGLSCEVKVDIRNSQLDMISNISKLDVPYSTYVYDAELFGYDQMIDSIIYANISE